jgi:hypothetical protein
VVGTTVVTGCPIDTRSVIILKIDARSVIILKIHTTGRSVISPFQKLDRARQVDTSDALLI